MLRSSRIVADTRPVPEGLGACPIARTVKGSYGTDMLAAGSLERSFIDFFFNFSSLQGKSEGQGEGATFSWFY